MLKMKAKTENKKVSDQNRESMLHLKKLPLPNSVLFSVYVAVSNTQKAEMRYI